MSWQSPSMRKLLRKDPALAARVALWESCGLYVRMYLLRLQLKVAKP